MSFLSDLFHGNFGNLGNDLNPSNIFSDAGTDITNTLKNPLDDLGIAAGIAAPFLLPELGAALGLGGAAGSVAADTGFDLGTIGPGVTASGTALGDAGLTAADAAIPVSATLDAGGVPSSLTSAFDNAFPATTTTSDLTAPGATNLFQAGADTSPVSALTGNIGSVSATSSTGGGNFLTNLISGAENQVTKNPLSLLVAGGGLAYDVLKGNKTDPNQAQLQAEAPQLQAQGTALTQSGQQLQTYLTNGTLPPALQTQVSNAVAAAKAQIISNAAANGQSTNPTQNSALAQELAQADLNGLSMAGNLEQQLFQSGTQLLQTGVNETGLSTQIYEALVSMDKANNTQLMSSIASMAAALGGGTKINLGSGGTSITV